jgi:ABC-2 type transport system ATP-binding protein
MTKRVIVHLLLAIFTFFSAVNFGSLSASAQDNSSAPKIAELRLPGAGKVQLDASLYLPRKLPAPAIMLAHGFTGDKSSVAAQAKQLQDAGYVVMAWTARGFGKSTGEISLTPPKVKLAMRGK